MRAGFEIMVRVRLRGRAMRRRAAIVGTVCIVSGALVVAGGDATAVGRVGCGDYLLLGSRGSGEIGPGSDGWAPTASDPFGLGGPLNSLRDGLVAATASRRHLETISLPYPAAGVDTLVPSQNVLDTYAIGGAALAAADYASQVTEYMGSVEVGVAGAMTTLVNRANSCPDERLVLAGYSQGAIVMNRVTGLLSSSGRSDISSRIEGVVLVADGDRMPGSRVKYLVGDPKAAGRGGRGIAPALLVGTYRDVPKNVADRTISICAKDDLVCDFAWKRLGEAQLGVAIHLSYTDSPAVKRAAEIIGDRLLDVPAPESQAIMLQSGVQVATRLKADVSAGRTLEWIKEPGTEWPERISLLKNGRLTGEPRAGSNAPIKSRVRVRAVGGKRAATMWVGASIYWSTPDRAALEPGRVSAWGGDSGGAIGSGGAVGGNGAGAARPAPTSVVGADSVVAVAGGAGFSIALREDGSLLSWGWNGSGQLGLGISDDLLLHLAEPVTGLPPVKQIAAGDDHVLALTRDGHVFAWGYNGHGQLGLGDTEERATPVRIPGVFGAKWIAAGQAQSFAVLDNGEVLGWGLNDSQQLGFISNPDVLLPLSVRGLSGITSVDTGSHHTLAIDSQGAVWAWGDNSVGSLGVGDELPRNGPVLVSSLPPIASVAAGRGDQSLARTVDGNVYAWGDNYYGGLGLGANRSVPTAVPALSGADAIDLGAGYGIALIHGSAVTWGDNMVGQRGMGDLATYPQSTLVPLRNEVIAVAAAPWHVLAVTRP